MMATMYGVKIPSAKEGKARCTRWFVIKDFECIGVFAAEYGQGEKDWVCYIDVPLDGSQNLVAINGEGTFCIPMYPKEYSAINTDPDMLKYDYDIPKYIEKFRDKIQANIDRQIHVFY